MMNPKKNDTLLLYIHGKGGSPVEAEYYAPLFPDCDVLGLTYHADTPWAAQQEFPAALAEVSRGYAHVILLANSIGAYFSICAMPQDKIARAYFISPIVDMQRLIEDMMGWAHVAEDELRSAGSIATGFGETLSWDYLCWTRSHPICWQVPTSIAYGDRDHLTSRATIAAFAQACGARLSIMEDGEHWFHTPEQMAFLEAWLRAEEQRFGGEADRA